MNTRPQAQKTGTLFLFIGPSGVGKSTILKAILKKQKALKLQRVVTVTTRKPRPGEVNGVSYFFVDGKKFNEMIRRGELLEWVRVHNQRSGTPLHPTIDLLARGHNLILHIDVKGADTLQKVKKLKTVSIFIAPTSLQELRQRLAKRHYISAAERETRWQTALKEMRRMNDFDFRVINKEGEVHQTIREVEEIIRAIR